jgi:hypothetical protein
MTLWRWIDQKIGGMAAAIELALLGLAFVVVSIWNLTRLPQGLIKHIPWGWSPVFFIVGLGFMYTGWIILEHVREIPKWSDIKKNKEQG